MKKIFLSCLISFASLTILNAQAPLSKGGSQLNAGVGFSSYGIPLHVGIDFGIHPNITVGPQLSYRRHSERLISTNFIHSITVLGFNGNYHFNKLMDISSDFDFYAGLTVGYYIWSSPSDYRGSRASSMGLDAQIGGRYFFSDEFGVNLEFGGGTVSGGKIGITYIF